MKGFTARAVEDFYPAAFAGIIDDLTQPLARSGGGAFDHNEENGGFASAGGSFLAPAEQR